MLGARQDLQRRKALKKLHELEAMLALSEDRAFLQLAWAVNILQSDFGVKVDRFLRFPPRAATDDMASDLAVHKWDIETLITLLLSTPKKEFVPGEQRRSLQTDRFDTMAVAVNLLRDTENHQAGAYLGDGTILWRCHASLIANSVGSAGSPRRSDCTVSSMSTDKAPARRTSPSATDCR